MKYLNMDCDCFSARYGYGLCICFKKTMKNHLRWYRELPLGSLCICSYLGSEFFIYIFVYKSTPSFDLYSFSFFILFLSILLHMNKFFIPFSFPPPQANDEENNITHFVLLQIYNFFLFFGEIFFFCHRLLSNGFGKSRACSWSVSFYFVRWALIWADEESENI